MVSLFRYKKKDYAMDVVTQLIEDFTLRPYQIRNTLLYTKLIQRLYFIYFFKRVTFLFNKMYFTTFFNKRDVQP